jgi:hypothetical protein
MRQQKLKPRNGTDRLSHGVKSLTYRKLYTCCTNLHVHCVRQFKFACAIQLAMKGRLSLDLNSIKLNYHTNTCIYLGVLSTADEKFNGVNMDE